MYLHVFVESFVQFVVVHCMILQRRTLNKTWTKDEIESEKQKKNKIKCITCDGHKKQEWILRVSSRKLTLSLCENEHHRILFFAGKKMLIWLKSILGLIFMSMYVYLVAFI